MMTTGKRAQREQVMFADVLGREAPESPGTKTGHRWDSKRLRDLGSLSLPCWEGNQIAFILVSMCIQCAE